MHWDYLYLKEAGGFQNFLYILLCDEHLAGVGIVQEYIHGFCVNSFKYNLLFVFLS